MTVVRNRNCSSGMRFKPGLSRIFHSNNGKDHQKYEPLRCEAASRLPWTFGDGVWCDGDDFLELLILEECVIDLLDRKSSRYDRNIGLCFCASLSICIAKCFLDLVPLSFMEADNVVELLKSRCSISIHDLSYGMKTVAAVVCRIL